MNIEKHLQEVEQKWDIKGVQMPRDKFEDLFYKYKTEKPENPFFIIFTMIKEERDFRFQKYLDEHPDLAGEKKQEAEHIFINSMTGNNRPGSAFQMFFDMNRKDKIVESYGLDKELINLNNKDIFEKELDVKIFESILDNWLSQQDRNPEYQEMSDESKKDSIQIYKSLRNRLLDKLLEKYGSK